MTRAVHQPASQEEDSRYTARRARLERAGGGSPVSDGFSELHRLTRKADTRQETEKSLFHSLPPLLARPCCVSKGVAVGIGVA